MRFSELQPEFVELIPPQLEEGVLYVSMDYGTAIHLCACGCEEKVITPLTPTDWRLIFDGQTVTLWPSIGNWGFACRSHYVIKKNKIRWAEDWSQSKVKANRDRQRRDKKLHFHELSRFPVHPPAKEEAPGLLRRLRNKVDLLK